jgi:hypothetical protein
MVMAIGRLEERETMIERVEVLKQRMSWGMKWPEMK